ncbi:MAG: hypothetical protein AAFO77_06460 [Pseudomonadota bacterium]
MRLSTVLVLGLGCTLVIGTASAATISNGEAESITLIVTENGERSEVVLAAGQTQAICTAGCFLTLPNGDRVVLSGTETVSIANGRALIE